MYIESSSKPTFVQQTEDKLSLLKVCPGVKVDFVIGVVLQTSYYDIRSVVYQLGQSQFFGPRAV